MDDKDHITICICTYKRPDLLEILLNKLESQETAFRFQYSIVIIDNDIEGSAKEIVAQRQKDSDVSILYDIEPDKCIASARNRSVSLARGNYIAFIDDDEFPTQQWLLEMYRSIQLFDSDGALGPVFPFFRNAPPKWLLKGRFCERPTHRTGSWLNWEDTRTGNVLLKRRVFDEHELWFDIKYRTSGSDKEFFREAMALGYRFISANEAPVYEVVPLARQSVQYYLNRAMVQASNERRFREPFLAGRLRFTVPLWVLTALCVNTALLFFSFVIGKYAVVKYLEKCTYHSSWLLAMIGINLAKKRNF